MENARQSMITYNTYVFQHSSNLTILFFFTRKKFLRTSFPVKFYFFIKQKYSYILHIHLLKIMQKILFCKKYYDTHCYDSKKFLYNK